MKNKAYAAALLEGGIHTEEEQLESCMVIVKKTVQDHVAKMKQEDMQITENYREAAVKGQDKLKELNRKLGEKYEVGVNLYTDPMTGSWEVTAKAKMSLHYMIRESLADVLSHNMLGRTEDMRITSGTLRTSGPAILAEGPFEGELDGTITEISAGEISPATPSIEYVQSRIMEGLHVPRELLGRG